MKNKSNKDAKEFEKYATKHLGIGSLALHDYKKNMTPYAMMIPNSTMTPYIMEERQMNMAQIDVFSRLMMERIIWMSGVIEDFNATVIQAQIMYLESVDNKKDITLHIDSCGGSVVAGLKLLDMMDYVQCDIRTINTGMAASMASVILGAGKKGKRQSLRNSRTMLHQSSGGAIGNIQDARIMMEEWEKYNKELFVLLGKYCNKKPEQVIRDSERDKWLTSNEAVEYGIIDSLIVPKSLTKK